MSLNFIFSELLFFNIFIKLFVEFENSEFSNSRLFDFLQLPRFQPRFDWILYLNEIIFFAKKLFLILLMMLFLHLAEFYHRFLRSFRPLEMIIFYPVRHLLNYFSLIHHHLLSIPCFLTVWFLYLFHLFQFWFFYFIIFLWWIYRSK